MLTKVEVTESGIDTTPIFKGQYEREIQRVPQEAPPEVWAWRVQQETKIAWTQATAVCAEVGGQAPNAQADKGEEGERDGKKAERIRGKHSRRNVQDATQNRRDRPKTEPDRGGVPGDVEQGTLC